MTRETLDSLVQVIFTLPLEDREYVISRLQSALDNTQEDDLSGFSDAERDAVETYLVQRAENAAKRIDDGHYLTHEQAMTQMNQYVASKTRVVV